MTLGLLLDKRLRWALPVLLIVALHFYVFTTHAPGHDVGGERPANCERSSQPGCYR